MEDGRPLPPPAVPEILEPAAPFPRPPLGGPRPADAGPRRVPVAPARHRSPALNVVLFLATLVTTTMAGAFSAGQNPLGSVDGFLSGLPFSTTLMAILLCHELGHYALAVYHRVPTTLPYFIPGPPFLVGTFGAFIRMYGMPRSRRALFDVGAAGPWAGLVVALPAVALGLSWSEVHPLAALPDGGLVLGDSILFSALTRWILGVDPSAATIVLHPVALAGWFGLFVTFLNLLPVGQLDGGHVIYALFGRRHHRIARTFFLVVLALGFFGWEGWFLWAIMLAFAIGVRHPDTADAETPLDPRRRLAAWLTLGVFALTFMPVPLSVTEPAAPRHVPAPQQRRAPPLRPHPHGPHGLPPGVPGQDGILRIHADHGIPAAGGHAAREARGAREA